MPNIAREKYFEVLINITIFTITNAPSIPNLNFVLCCFAYIFFKNINFITTNSLDFRVTLIYRYYWIHQFIIELP